MIIKDNRIENCRGIFIGDTEIARSWCWWWQHRWRAQAVQHATVKPSGLRGTFILYRCQKCSQTCVRERLGHWALTDIVSVRGEDGA